MTDDSSQLTNYEQKMMRLRRAWDKLWKEKEELQKQKRDQELLTEWEVEICKQQSQLDKREERLHALGKQLKEMGRELYLELVAEGKIPVLRSFINASDVYHLYQRWRNYPSVARKVGIPEEEVRRIVKRVRKNRKISLSVGKYYARQRSRIHPELDNSGGKPQVDSIKADVLCEQIEDL